LRSQEAEILSKINAALEKENLEKERENPGLSSGVLGKDIEGVREKIERMGREKERKEGEGVKSAKGAVVKCYL
jgi:altered-inheritance-of-mitochondria protein 13